MQQVTAISSSSFEEIPFSKNWALWRTVFLPLRQQIKSIDEKQTWVESISIPLRTQHKMPHPSLYFRTPFQLFNTRLIDQLNSKQDSLSSSKPANQILSCFRSPKSAATKNAKLPFCGRKTLRKNWTAMYFQFDMSVS